MYPERSRHQQTGAGLPVALFIITVLALLVIGMAQLQESSGKAVSLQIQSQRAFFAAESGAQVGVQQLLFTAGTGLVSTSICPTGRIEFSGSGLNNCSATLACTGNFSVESVRLVSEGQCGVGDDASSRTVEVTIR